MPRFQWIFGNVGVVLLLVLAGILIWRGHHRRLPVFTAYVVGVAMSNFLYGLYATWGMWMVHQIVSATLRFAFTLELAHTIFGAFPGAAATARRGFLVVLVLFAAVGVGVVTPGANYSRANAEAVPRVASAAIWMLTALAFLVLWYRLPIGAFLRAILMGYAPYLLIFSVGMGLLFDPNWQHLRRWIGYVDTGAFFVLILYLSQAAWRIAPETKVILSRAAARPRPIAAAETT